jgi:hypothetical protein
MLAVGGTWERLLFVRKWYFHHYADYWVIYRPTPAFKTGFGRPAPDCILKTGLYRGATITTLPYARKRNLPVFAGTLHPQ